MFDKFGEFGSAEEINKSAAGLKAEGDVESLKALAKENGLDEYDVQDYMDGAMPVLCSVTTAALGKLAVEKNDLKLSEIVSDWVGYIESELMEDEALAKGVRKKGKSLIGCVGAILAWSYKNAYSVDSRIIKASGISVGSVKMGIPGMERAKEIIRGYYA